MEKIRNIRFCIDRGGTFTDIFAEVPTEPGWCAIKLLSVDPGNYDDAPREGIRRILEQVNGEPISREAKLPTKSIDWIRMGTTVATNALLERKGIPTAFCVTKGFKDLLKIGNQARPNIFDLKVTLPDPLYSLVVEVDERVQLWQGDTHPPLEEQHAGKGGFVQGVSGEWVQVVQAFDAEKLRPKLQAVLEQGVDSLAVALLHSYTFPQHEQAVARLALSMGFKQVSLSAELMPMVRIVPRGHTSVVDAYLTPVIQNYLSTFLEGFDEGLKDVKVSFMQSDGGLTPASHFSGFKAILSGPAGGVVGYAQTMYKIESDLPVIGFDMGGTSTDVSRYHGSYEQVLETRTAGVAIQAPQLDINTVAAGGGSKLHFHNGVFKVGPDSVSAHPGPVCYRKGGQLAVTDANLLLGRVLPDFFPKIFGPSENEALDVDASRLEFSKLTHVINEARKEGAGHGSADMSVEEVALGFLTVANEEMCRAIRQLTEMKGHDASHHLLSCFGGAGPQHACAIARALNMRRVVVHRYCGILSAYGMGLADTLCEAQEPCALACQPGSGGAVPGEVHLKARALTRRVEEELKEQGFKQEAISTQVLLNLRYEGTDTSIMTPEPEDGSANYVAAFVKQFRTEYGFELQGRSVVVDDVRVRGVGKTNILRSQVLPVADWLPEAEAVDHSCYFEAGWYKTPVYLLEKLGRGHRLEGPVIVLNGNSTIVVEPGCIASVTPHGNVQIDVAPPSAAPPPPPSAAAAAAAVDVIQLSVLSNRFMGIAEQMGRTLQRTSISTNIKERLDFSCALFSPDGGLVANAPHVPVHLGAMASTVKWQVQHWGDSLAEGDVLVTNHPAAGGSHLPDITVITPVFSSGRCLFFVASRGHHAEIGGSTPGSMPPFSKTIFEEGAAIKAFKLVENGIFQEDGIRQILESSHVLEDGMFNSDSPAPSIPGTRKIEDNMSDLRAQVAANQRGIQLLQELIAQRGLSVVQAYMKHVQDNAETAVRGMLKAMAKQTMDRLGLQDSDKLSDGKTVVLQAEDYMDDGSVICLKLTIDGEKGEAHFDFTGTGPEVYGNWNAPEAVTAAAVIYCIRCLVDTDMPLNQGCLAPVKITIPSGSFLSPSDKAAVVGGNVLTSQRITDVVLSAFQACACSQGDMNNLTFGDRKFGYYETIGGGCGAGPTWDGSSGVQCHMTNTRITDPEILERRYPVILKKFCLRDGSGGAGLHAGGDGVIREIQFRQPIVVSILSERRVHSPRGMNGGQNGHRGVNMLLKSSGEKVYLGGKNTIYARKGDTLQIMTPGGGGWGPS